MARTVLSAAFWGGAKQDADNAAAQLSCDKLGTVSLTCFSLACVVQCQPTRLSLWPDCCPPAEALWQRRLGQRIPLQYLTACAFWRDVVMSGGGSQIRCLCVRVWQALQHLLMRLLSSLLIPWHTSTSRSGPGGAHPPPRNRADDRFCARGSGRKPRPYNGLLGRPGNRQWSTGGWGGSGAAAGAAGAERGHRAAGAGGIERCALIKATHKGLEEVGASHLQ